MIISEKSNQTDELYIEVERKPKGKEVNRSLTGDSTANRTMKSEYGEKSILMNFQNYLIAQD